MRTERTARRRRVHRRYNAEDRERLVEEQAKSGQTKRAFCQQRGIVLQTFYNWSKRRAIARRPAFAQVEVAAPIQAAVEVLLPNGTRIGIRHEGGREELVALVRGVAGC